MCLRYGVTCRRVGCYFKHPEGRQIDNAKPGSAVEGGSCGGVQATGSNTNPPSMEELTNGFSSTYVLLPCMLNGKTATGKCVPLNLQHDPKNFINTVRWHSC